VMRCFYSLYRHTQKAMESASRNAFNSQHA